MNSAETRREIIRIMLDNIFLTPWSRRAHFETYNSLSNRLFFRLSL